MQYTENYQFRKPVIGIDVADVKDINFNSDRADTLIHNTQISLAPAYDLNETYDTGDVVMYETLMYKCKADNITGAWDASKWERTTAGEEGAGGGGGSSVIPNPQGSPTDTLETIEIEGTVYDIAGSGGGSNYTDTVIYENTAGTTGASSITLSDSLYNYDALYFEYFFPNESTYVESTPSPIVPIIETPSGSTKGKYYISIYPTYGSRYIQLISDGSTSASLTTGTWGEAIMPSVYRIHGVKFAGGGAGSAVKDVLYSNANGAPHQTDVALAHNIFDYDEVYFKVSNPTDIQAFNAYTQQVFMPMMYNVGERWGIQALYDQRVVEITFPSDGLSFRIVRTAGDYSNNTVYEVIGIKH